MTLFNNKELNVKLVYMGFGGIIAVIGMLFAIGMLTSVTAHNDKFDKIQCSRLEVVDADGIPRVILTSDEHGGRVVVYGKDWKKSGLSDDGGALIATGKDWNSVSLHIDEHGGRVVAWGKDLKSASLCITERSGAVLTSTKYGNEKILD